MPISLVNKIRLSNYTARSFIELLVFMIILSGVLFISLNNNNNNFIKDNHNKNLLKLKRLQDALHLARSSAMSLKTKVYLCPSGNQKTCSSSWNNGIIIFTLEQENNYKIKLLYYLSPIFTNTLLRFHFFAEQDKQRISFLPNGFTINNGHFCTEKRVYCLYINQAGKTYITSDY